MAAQTLSAHDRLIRSALTLFIAQGVTATTTREIADLAEVNEATLFRHFKSKYGLLLAVLQEAETFPQLAATLGQQAAQAIAFDQALQDYAESQLAYLQKIREFVRSLIGEAGQYPPENRAALGKRLEQVHDYTVQYLNTVLATTGTQVPLSSHRLARLMNTLILGYSVLDFTTEAGEIWSDAPTFIADVVTLLSAPALPATRPLETTPGETSTPPPLPVVMDLPAALVRQLLQAARKAGTQTYALFYVLFGAGLTAAEVARLARSHAISDPQQHILQVPGALSRQVPVNQWILGHRYGSYTHNPLTQWLKNRKDTTPALFINEAGEPMTELEIRLQWQSVAATFLTPTGNPPAIEHAAHTWRVEMLMRGLAPGTLSILTGCPVAELTPYQRRAHERAALEQAIRLDQKTSGKGETGS